MTQVLEAVSKRQEGSVTCAYPAQEEGQIAPEQGASHMDPSTSSGSSPGKLERRSEAGRDRRAHRARREPAQSRFPSVGYLTYLVRDLGYEGSAAFAAIVQAHQPWLRSVDRRRAKSIDVDSVVTSFKSGREGEPEPKFKWKRYSRLTSVVRPYVPAAPARCTHNGGGLTKEQVERALAKKRWHGQMKKAMFEIVYRRRSNLQVSNESGISVEILAVYASRLRRDIQNGDLGSLEKAA